MKYLETDAVEFIVFGMGNRGLNVVGKVHFYVLLVIINI